MKINSLIPVYDFSLGLYSTSCEFPSINTVIQYFLFYPRFDDYNSRTFIPDLIIMTAEHYQNTKFWVFWMDEICKEMGWNMGWIALASMIANRFHFEWRSMIITWEISRCSHFKHHIPYVAPTYIAIFFSKQGNHTHQYTFAPFPLFVIHNIDSIEPSSICLWCEVEHCSKQEYL